MIRLFFLYCKYVCQIEKLKFRKFFLNIVTIFILCLMTFINKPRQYTFWIVLNNKNRLLEIIFLVFYLTYMLFFKNIMDQFKEIKLLPLIML